MLHDKYHTVCFYIIRVISVGVSPGRSEGLSVRVRILGCFLPTCTALCQGSIPTLCLPTSQQKYVGEVPPSLCVGMRPSHCKPSPHVPRDQGGLARRFKALRNCTFTQLTRLCLLNFERNVIQPPGTGERIPLLATRGNTESALGCPGPG